MGKGDSDQDYGGSKGLAQRVSTLSILHGSNPQHVNLNKNKKLPVPIM